MSSYINYQSEITIIFPLRNGKLIAFEEGERKLILPLCARAQPEQNPIRFWAISSGYHNSLDFMRNRANTCSTLRPDSLCVIFVADFYGLV